MAIATYHGHCYYIRCQHEPRREPLLPLLRRHITTAIAAIYNTEEPHEPRIALTELRLLPA